MNFHQRFVNFFLIRKNFSKVCVVSHLTTTEWFTEETTNWTLAWTIFNAENTRTVRAIQCYGWSTTTSRNIIYYDNYSSMIRRLWMIEEALWRTDERSQASLERTKGRSDGTNWQLGAPMEWTKWCPDERDWRSWRIGWDVTNLTTDVTLATKNDGQQCSDWCNYNRLCKCEATDAQSVAPGTEPASVASDRSLHHCG